MKIGLTPINVGIDSPAEVVELAIRAESLGFESVWSFEHPIIPVDCATRYPSHNDGGYLSRSDTPFLDPLIALTTAAAHTKTIRLGTGVSILPQANPLLLAKQAASLDFLSGGRLMLGTGLGWMPEEFEAMGVPFERRGARHDDYVKAMRKVWSGEAVEHQSEFLHWSGFQSFPLPIQKGGIPVIIGGASGKVFERIASLGDGWFAPVFDHSSLKPLLEHLQAECHKIGRKADTIEISTFWNPENGLESLHHLEAMGVARVIVPLYTLGSDPLSSIESVATEFIPK